jgi:8-oxo-dGTP diphosphatase
MKQETSAGGIIYKKEKNGIKVALILDFNGQWTFPKGLVEKDEEPNQAALREIQEETGLKLLKIIHNLGKVEYFYRWRRGLIHKTVYYYLIEAPGNETVHPQSEEDIKDVQWFRPKEAQELIGYKQNSLPILEKALSKLSPKSTRKGTND